MASQEQPDPTGANASSRLQRALDTVRASHRALLQAGDEGSLLQEITRVAVEVGGYRFAWIGYAEDGASRTVRPLARAGAEAGYLDEIRITWDRDSTGQGPVGQSIRSGEPVIVRDTATDPQFAPWRGPALQRGLRAVISIPLLDEDGAFGALAVYADEAGAFGPHEAGLLQDLAADLAFGVVLLRDQQRWQGERERLVSLLEATPDFVAIADAAGRVLYRNAGAWRMLGKDPPSQGQEGHLEDFLPEWARDRLRTQALPAAREEGTWQGESALLRADGSEVPVSQIVVAHFGPGGAVSHYDTILRDISRLKHTEAELRKLSSVAEQSGDMVWITDAAGTIEYVNPRFTEVTGFTPEEARGASVGRLLAPGHQRPDFYRDMEHRLARGEAFQDTFLHQTRNGRLVYLEETISPLRAEDGEVRHHVATARDVTDRLSLERRLEEAQHLAQVGSWELDPVSRKAYWSQETYRILGISPARSASPEAFLERVHPDDRDRVRQALEASLADQTDYEVTYRIVRPDGEVRSLLSRARVDADANGRTLRMVGAVMDVTEFKAAEERIQHLAYYDPLTGLPNRHLFAERLAQALSHAHRHNRVVAVLLLDLDQFRQINDALGHEVGDQVLKEVAQRLDQVLREGDIAARFSEDQFGVLLDDLAEENDILATVQTLRDRIGQSLPVSGHELVLTVCLGISAFPTCGRDAATLLRSADTALHRAKDEGRDRYAFFNPEMHARAAEHLGMEAALRQALERDELFLLYQPQVDLASGEIIGVEALLRWQHPEWGTISPARFIPVLEDTGLIVPVSEWVLDTACRQARQWEEAGHRPIRMGVNLSVRHFAAGKSLVRGVTTALEDSGLDPERLELEITESLFLEDLPGTLGILQTLHGMGVRFALDDFGTGYSALAYLRSFPIDTLKVDRSFIQGMDSPQSEELVRAIVNMAQPFSLDVVAEGVEDWTQAARLRSMGCPLAQGFGYSRPIPPEEVAELLATDAPLVPPPGGQGGAQAPAPEDLPRSSSPRLTPGSG